MSKYTTEVRFICENSAGLVDSEGYNSINQILSDCVDSVFNFDYPIFDENYRRTLNIKILKHYYTREIGFETVGLWKHFLETRLNEIMPYYNKLYESELLNFNPFYDVDLTTTRSTIGTNIGNENGTRSDNINEKTGTEGVVSRDSNTKETIDNDTNETVTGTENRKDTGTITDNGTSSTTRTDNLSEQTRDGGTETDSGSDIRKNTRWDIYSDTPQGGLTDVDEERYLTNARKIIDDGTGSTNTNTKTFGKTVNKTNTGTTQTQGTDTNTRTLGTNSNVDNINSVTGSNTSKRKTDTNSSDTTSTNVTKTGTNSGTSSKEHNINTTEDYIEHVKGKTPGISYAKLLKEFRETFLNIDMMIIRDLADLFFNLW